MGSRLEVIAKVPFGEGPAWCDNGTLVCTSVGEGRLYRVWPEERRTEVIADIGGGANSCVPAADGGFLVTQNGGIDLRRLDLPGVTTIPPYAPVTPGLQQVAADGTARYIATHVDDGTALQAPNDLVVTPDGDVYFTDPGKHGSTGPPVGRILKLDREGIVSVVDAPYRYCNGIALDLEGALLVVEEAGLLRLHDSSREWIIERLGNAPGDGLCVDVEGNIYVACSADNCVRVLDPSGTIIEQLDLATSAQNGVVTNCCFGGDDGRTLFATQALPGVVVMWRGLPHPGRVVHPWPGAGN